MALQRAYFPMKTLNLTQGYGSKSSTHKYSYALDLAGKDSGKDEVYAPFDCKVTKLYQPSSKSKAPEVWLTSTKKVLCKNGCYGYLTMSLTHSTDVYKMKLGQTFKQGQIVCHEGNQGISSGNHIHLELSTGTKAGWQVIKGNYVNVNNVKPEDYLFVREDSIVKNATYKGTKYNFVKESSMTYKIVNVTKPPLNVHSEANYNSNNIVHGLKNGDEVIKFYEKNGMAYIYNYGKLGYISSKYLKKK